jgi:putative ABC transport system permease protein
MTALRVWISRVLDLLLRRRRDDRLAEEIANHLDLLEAEHVDRGLSPEDARLAARRAFGGVDQLKEAYRAQRGLPRIDTLAQDVRFAVRLLRRDPAFTVTIVTVLALGIGVNSMMFTIVNAHAIRGLPIRDADRVVYLTTADDKSPDMGVSYLDFSDWQAGVRTFDALAAFTRERVVLSGDGAVPERLSATYISASGFRVVGVQPILGRDFLPSDDRPGAPAVMLVGEATWRARHASAPSILGRAVLTNGVPTVIVGVVPDRSGFPSSGSVWLPLGQHPTVREEPRQQRSLAAIGRLLPGRDLQQARVEIESISGRLAVEHPETNKSVRARVMTINEGFVASVRNPAWIVFTAVGLLVVAISSANAANLMLSRGLTRLHEIALRRALGASRARVVRQLCIEGAAIALLAAAAGLAMAMAGVRIFRFGIPTDALPYWNEYSIDLRVLLVLAGVAAVTVLVFALLPALQCSKPDVNLELKEGGHTAALRRSSRWTTVFLAAEFGLAVVLLAQFAVNLRVARQTLHSDLALRSAPVLTAEIQLPSRPDDPPERRLAFLNGLQQRLAALDGVDMVSSATVLPLDGGESRTLAIDPGHVGDAKDLPATMTVAISPGYFATLGLSVLRGRDFTAADGSPAQLNAIVNERFVERFLPGREPIGERIGLGKTPSGALEWVTIVGVAPSVRQRATPLPAPVVYLPLRSAPPDKLALLVRSSVPTAALTDRLRSEVAALDAGLPLDRVRTLAQALRDAEWVGRISRDLANTLTLIAVLLAGFGLAAVTSYTVRQRAQEIGVRIALGASQWQIVRFVGRRILFQLAVGLLTGLVFTRIWSAMFSSGSSAITASDLQSIAVIGAILMTVSVLACALPVRRATTLDPVSTLRRE